MDLYDSLVAPLDKESIIHYWAMGNKAGALWNLNRNAESAYLFSAVFDRCEDRRFSSFVSFRIKSDSVFQECLKLCKSDHERSTLYFLRGISPSSNALEEMSEMYKLEPASEQLEVLLVREIVKLESELVNIYSEDRPDRRGRNDAVTGTQNYLIQLHEFIDNCLLENKVRTPDAWRLSLGYTFFMGGQYANALKVFENILNKHPDPDITHQANLLREAARIALLQHIDSKTEDEIPVEVTSLTHAYLYEYMVNRFHTLYASQGDSLKAYLCENNIQDVQNKPQREMIDRCLQLAQKKNKTQFEEHLLSSMRPELGNEYDWNSMVYGPKSPVDFLNEVKATILLSEDKLEEAVAIFKELPPDMLDELVADPFIAQISDCRDCAFKENPGQGWNKRTLAQRMIDLKKKIESDPANAAQYHFLLGSAYYSMTHFGVAAEAIDYHRNPDFDFFWRSAGSATDTEYVDCSRALQHFDLGMKLAENIGNNELAAQCCFMASKCEQNKYYFSGVIDRDGKLKNLLYRTYFRLMRKKYDQTKYYQEVLNECKYFKYFVTHH